MVVNPLSASKHSLREYWKGVDSDGKSVVAEKEMEKLKHSICKIYGFRLELIWNIQHQLNVWKNKVSIQLSK